MEYRKFGRNVQLFFCKCSSHILLEFVKGYLKAGEHEQLTSILIVFLNNGNKFF